MRDKRRGYPAVVSVGYRKSAKGREKLDGMKPIYIMNVKDIAKIGKGEIGVVGNVGKKKKIEIAKKALERKVIIYNINVEKFLNKNQMKEKMENKK